ncbi:MAG: lysylphosphatidylglycerol synthase transmembrane domain-containing protein [Promethearchaeota archaeon]
MKINKKIFFILKLAFSLILIFFLIKHIDFTILLNNVSKINFILVIFALFLLFIGVLISSLKYYYIIKDNINYKLTFIQILKYYFIGIFFNNFLPGTISGDLVRAYKVNKHGKNKFYSFFSIVLERYLGFFSLIILVIILVIFQNSLLSLQKSVQLILFLLFIISSILFVLLITRSYRILNFNRFLKKIIRNFDIFKTKTIFIALFFSFIFQGIVLLIYYLIALSLNIQLNFSFLAPIVLISIIITTIPISFQGLGVREGIFIYLLSFYGINAEIAFLLGFLPFILNIIMGIFGGFVYLSD